MLRRAIRFFGGLNTPVPEGGRTCLSREIHHPEFLGAPNLNDRRNIGPHQTYGNKRGLCDLWNWRNLDAANVHRAHPVAAQQADFLCARHVLTAASLCSYEETTPLI